MHRYTCRSPQAPKPSPVSITFLLSISQSTSPSLSVFLTLPHTSSQGRSPPNLIQNLLRGFYPLKGSFSLSLLPLLTETSGSLNSLFTTLYLVGQKKCIQLRTEAGNKADDSETKQYYSNYLIQHGKTLENSRKGSCEVG